jgi:hypothetical protein
MNHNHGGSSTTGTGAFKKKNRELAEAYWYIVAGVVGFCGVIRLIDYVQVVRRLVETDFSLPSCCFSGALILTSDIMGFPGGGDVEENTFSHLDARQMFYPRRGQQ